MISRFLAFVLLCPFIALFKYRGDQRVLERIRVSPNVFLDNERHLRGHGYLFNLLLTALVLGCVIGLFELVAGAIATITRRR